MSYQNKQQYGGGQKGHGSRSPAVDYKAMTSYFDKEGRLRQEIFIEWPQTIANNIGVSRTNMRRTYDFIAALKFQLDMGKGDPADIIQTGMGQLYRFAEYQAGRKQREWAEAKKFIQEHVLAVGNDQKKFMAFYQLFQSVMANLKGR